MATLLTIISFSYTFVDLLLCVCTHISGSLLPVTVFDKHSLRVLFTFARDCPPSRPDVLVVIISMLSSAPIPVTNIRFQAAVPKVGYIPECEPYLFIVHPSIIVSIALMDAHCLGDESKAAASLQY